ncbi:MBOAT family O-acyltransferase [Entomobacter blattae]|uniref:Probable alginate O-acetylase AlgI n=1 Tax=Entomobacter blattae TaxID=2762277 RepID=A0A7H1NNY4_9PROT|nr:MBOAT family O-acyltransferase [Entomobacter blattae]QNT77494.1 Peptidoglycan O-acetyltransferase [Entomobacter blattae]
MLFTSQAFLLGFLPFALLCHYLSFRWRRTNQIVIIAVSFFFYGLWNWAYVPLLAGLGVMNWVLARYVLRSGYKKWLMLGIAFNLLVLCYFKYTNFLASILNTITHSSLGPWPIILPLGISFFIFQKISYLADLHHGDRHSYSLLDFMEFISFFPQLVAGPLVRHNELIPQFSNPQRYATLWKNTAQGILLLTIGLVKKAGLADELGKISNPLFNLATQGHALGTSAAWYAAISYSLQIYFDFSGYSDMAIGLALLFGLKLPYNFNAPYRATSLRDFWQRWHMTLSRFLRDYIYIPLGGNRKGLTCQCLNLLITMALGGLWHGAGWTFILWGFLHGFGLCINHFSKTLKLPVPSFLGWGLTTIFLLITWVFFRATDVSSAWQILHNMVYYTSSAGFKFHHTGLLTLACAIALIGPSSQNFVNGLSAPSPWMACVTAIIFILFIFMVGGRIQDAFIYFQF